MYGQSIWIIKSNKAEYALNILNLDKLYLTSNVNEIRVTFYSLYIFINIFKLKNILNILNQLIFVTVYNFNKNISNSKLNKHRKYKYEYT